MISMRNKKNCPSVIVEYLLLSRALSGQFKSVSGAMKVQCYSRQVNVPFLPRSAHHLSYNGLL